MNSGWFVKDNFSVGPFIIAFILLVFTLVNYFAAAFTDPGFLPRSAPHETNFTERTNNITVDFSGEYYPETKYKEMKINDVDYESKFCVS